VNVWYLDTSAAIKLAVMEPESISLRNLIFTQKPLLVSCRLLETELRRFAERPDNVGNQAGIDTLLEVITIYPVTDIIFSQAGRVANLPGRFLRSLDAIHLVAALRIGADTIVTYDTNLKEHAEHMGLTVLSPGVVTL